MTDLRKLAERIVVTATGIDQKTIDHAYYPDGVVDRVERILREHHERVVREIREASLNYSGDDVVYVSDVLQVLEEDLPIHQTNEVSDVPTSPPAEGTDDGTGVGARHPGGDHSGDAASEGAGDTSAQFRSDQEYIADIEEGYRELHRGPTSDKAQEYLRRIRGRLAMLAGSEQAAVPDAEGRRAHEPNPAPPVAAGQPDEEAEAREGFDFFDQFKDDPEYVAELENQKRLLEEEGAEASKYVTVLDDPLPEDADPAAIRKHEDVFRRAELYCRINTLEADLAEAEERAARHRIDAEEADAAAGKMGRELAKAEARIAELEQELARGRATMNVTFGEDRILALVRNAGQRWHRDLNDSGLLEEVLREQCALYGWGYIGPPRDPARDQTSLYCEFGRDVARAYVDRALSETREALK